MKQPPAGFAAVLLLLAGGCARDGAAPAAPQAPEARRMSPYQSGLVGRVDKALASAARCLVSRQSPDGAWRSETYGCFRDGPTLTPYVMSALFFLPQGGEETLGSFRKGVEYLVGFVDEEGGIKVDERELLFPVYASASASRVVALEKKDAGHLRAQAAWLAYLRGRQLNRALGWEPADREFGGWGFSLGIPRKPEAGGVRERFVESNLTATIFGIAALRSAKVPAEDPVYRDVLAFVKRCQNFADDPERADPGFDDGGFFFIPDDALQNKAGISGTDRFGRVRFHSYGTMTADGLRALYRCGLPKEHPRVAAARKWLEWNFSAVTNPGEFEADREVLRDATYYYWAWAAAHAFMGLGISRIETKNGVVMWAEVLTEELLRRQRPDGTWLNRFTDAKEDDPLVSTPWAAAALAICRMVIRGEAGGPGGRPRCPTLVSGT